MPPLALAVAPSIAEAAAILLLVGGGWLIFTVRDEDDWAFWRLATGAMMIAFAVVCVLSVTATTPPRP